MGGGDFTILREHAAFAWQRNTVARGRRSGGGREAARLYGTTQTWPAPRFSSPRRTAGYALPHPTLIKGEEPQTVKL